MTPCTVADIPEDGQSTTIIPPPHIPIILTQQPRHAKLSTLDPDPRSLIDRLKRHHPAIRTAHQPIFIARRLDGPRFRLELAVEELVERVERVERVEDFVQVEIVEGYEWENVGFGFGRVVFDALFDRH